MKGDRHARCVLMTYLTGFDVSLTQWRYAPSQCLALELYRLQPRHRR